MPSPMSLTLGPPGPSSTLCGVNPWWVTPASRIEVSAVRVPTATRSSRSPVSGPSAATASCKDRPSTCSRTR
nr:hypothetical protein [Microtetraspora sp. NBRC 13810]